MPNKYFKVSSALKNLIGSDLITDNFVAVFELVKNSFDANASKVNITFDNINTDQAKIVIQDNGKGMDYDDLIDKWLFLAYSSKKDGTEDDKKSKRNYAGSKGVGRFSCDRLGRYLNLITVKDIPNSKIENLKVDWTKFEENQKQEFSKIPISHTVLSSTDYNLEKGTVLEITGITPGFWDRDNFKKLKEKLSKLIRPDLNDSQKQQSFKIFLSVPDEILKDNEELEKIQDKDKNEIQLYYNTINGEIKNFVFTELDIKTTKIQAVLSKGKITTTLTDRENFIYKIVEKNTYDLLNDIDITLYFLNRSAKVTFKKRTGTEHIDYGSVFIYKNGFRIYPYGERRDDSLGLENRALQGYARYIGLRSLIGEISIKGENSELRETTSRGDGLVRTKTYHQLANTEDGFLVKVLRRLEKYAVDVTQWGVNNDDEIGNISSKTVKDNLVKLIANISDDKSIIDIEYNKNIIDLVANQEQKSAKKLVKNFQRIAAETNDPKLIKDAKKIEKVLTDSAQRVSSAEKERDKKIDEKKKVEVDLEQKTKQLRIVTSIASQDLESVTNLHHQVLVISENIKDNLTLLSRRIEKGESITKDTILGLFDTIAFDNSKIESISKLGTRAIFEDFTSISQNDLLEFTKNYVDRISNHFTSKSKITVDFQGDLSTPFVAKFRPLDISIIIDNMISNAKKANASKLSVITNLESPKKLNLIFKDNGDGLDKTISNSKSIFEKGFSTTKSTGLGLFHINNLIIDNKWKIDVNSQSGKGTEFIITITQ